MRIAIGQVWQETNTFNPVPTTQADFERFGVFRGHEVVERMADVNELGGFIEALRRWPEQPEIVGLVRLAAWPGGTVTQSTFSWIRQELLEVLQQQIPLDAVLLALHGSLASESVPDAEGELLGTVRQIIGPNTPLVATLDLHANITLAMVRETDALVLYHTIPHVDVFDTGRRGAEVLRRILIDGARPMTAFRKLALVLPVEHANTEDMNSVSWGFKRRLQQWEAEPKILAAGLATVQPWLDVPELGSAVVIVADGDRDLAESRCASLAADVWVQRMSYVTELLSVEDAVRQAYQSKEGLVVLSDGADATTSGAPGDSTCVLSELLKYDWPKPALVPLVGPEVVAEAHRLGVGAEFNGRLGGIRDYRFSRPLDVTVSVTKLFGAQFSMSGHLAKNLSIDMGPSVVLQRGNVCIVVTSHAGPHFAPEFFQTAGFDPFEASVVVAKSPCGFRAAYQGRAKEVLLMKSPGCAPPDFWHYHYQHLRHPIWPWDGLAESTWIPS
jgi:microcystin degradation protein MlrC